MLSVEEALLFLSVDDREYKGWWWLRTPGEHHDLATSVYKYGQSATSIEYLAWAWVNAR